MNEPKSGHAETMAFVSAFLLALHAGRFKNPVTMTTSIDPDGVPRLNWETEGDEDTATLHAVVEGLGDEAVPYVRGHPHCGCDSFEHNEHCPFGIPRL